MRSAQSLNGKIATLSQEVYRVLSNCSKDIKREEQVELLEEFTNRLQVSGYPPRTAGKILRNGITNFLRRLEKEKRGQLPLHRPEEYGKLERRMAKVVGKDRWFRRSKASSSTSEEE